MVGSHANLGSWVLADGPEMEWSPGDLWRADVALPAGGVYEYKYVLVGGGAGGRHALAWQRGNNSVLALNASETEAEVMDNWEGAPGAVVVVGGRAATREGQLLAWANEMEATIATQRSELRAVRMELAAMQEEVAQARQARVVLAQLQALRKQEAAALSEAQASNQVLRTQLVEATSAFHHALNIAQTLLAEAEEPGDNAIVC
ncbi:hypothetical protein WJX81_000946 [Elliptochloris bilobata]|uniref:CBM20 domain-containing protein n=1 Tax=Elliptochloris bilobata TaxID=381761 RepID=A0AAW1S4J7_9CHLO